MICGTYYIDSRVLILYEVNSDETISSQERVGDNDVNHFFSSHVPTGSKIFKPAAATFVGTHHCRLVILDGYLIQTMIVNSLSVYSASAPHVPEE
jgi:hypothetical protein